ncbi:hypothetical protein AB6A40_005976 [Gnathostoma spinigerum]|uniref:Phosphoglycerate mutase family protein n=1 Tax=Gnathostoma spinigerum TaxID=75299 RepID=A0ABD6ERU2_9BILA
MAPENEGIRSVRNKKRIIWAVRHGERIDNIDKTWYIRAPRGAWDDPPLSERGIQQAKECGSYFATQCIDAIICSPFIRCVQTATEITLAIPSHPALCIEPGICESLHVCQTPPGYLTPAEIKQNYPMVDLSYVPIVPQPEYQERNELDCRGRIEKVIRKSLERYAGELLFVSHGSPIAMFHEVLAGRWHYVGQCTISKFQSLKEDCFEAILIGSSSHLSDKTSLRDREIQKPKV